MKKIVNIGVLILVAATASLNATGANDKRALVGVKGDFDPQQAALPEADMTDGDADGADADDQPNIRPKTPQTEKGEIPPTPGS